MGVWVGVCPYGIFVFFFGYWLYFVKFTYMYACIHLFVCARMGVRACVRICVYVYAYLFSVCGMGGARRGGGGWRAGVVRAFVYMHVTMDVRIY